MSNDSRSRDAVRGAIQPGGPIGMRTVARAKDPRGTLRRLFGYFVEARGKLAFVAMLTTATTLLGLLGPWLMGRAIDQAIAGRSPALLAKLGAAMLFSYLLAAVFQALAGLAMASVSQRALLSLRNELFGHLQTLPLSFFERRASGDLMSRLTNDVDAIDQAAGQNVMLLFASVLTMAGIVIAMFVLDPFLALAALLVVPLMFVFTRWVAVYTRRGFQDLQRRLGGLNGVMEEALSGQRVITAFGRSESVLATFTDANEEVYRAGVRANTYALLLMPLTGVLGNLFVIVLAGLGGWLALSGLVSVGIIATFIHYGQNFVNPLRQVGNLYNTLQAALAGAERVFETLDEKPEVDDGEPHPAVKGEVELDHVTFAYPGGAPALADVSLHVAPGQTVALVGPTGAGKTTVLNLLTRFHEIDQGTIRIDGEDIRLWNKRDLRRALGLVLQDTYLFHATVMENLRYGRLDATDEEVIEAARLADADHFIRQLPHGYQTELSERAGNLSQGQRQLLSIARTLLARPAILLLDEATSSIDTRTELRIQRSLARLMEGRTSIVIAHRLSTIRDADRVLVIDGGRIVEEGTHDELLARRGFYHHLYQSQFKGHAL